MIQTRLGFNSLYFEICLEFVFCHLGFDQLHFVKERTIKSIQVL
jgi:hypothetical protein